MAFTHKHSVEGSLKVLLYSFQNNYKGKEWLLNECHLNYFPSEVNWNIPKQTLQTSLKGNRFETNDRAPRRLGP